MQELIQRIVDQAGISEEAATQAVDVVIAYIKEHAPAPVATQLEAFLASEQGTSMAGAVKSGLGRVFGKRGDTE